MTAELPSDAMRRLLLYGRINDLVRLAREVGAEARGRGDVALEAEAKNRLGEALFELFRYEEAHACFAEALAARSALLGPRDLATIHSVACLAAAAWALNRTSEALALHRRALAALPAEPRDEDRVLVSNTLQTLGTVEKRSRKDESGALPIFRRALALVDRPGVHELEIASACVALGMAEQSAGHERVAARHFERAHAIRERLLEDPHEYLAYTIHHMGALKIKSGDLEGARALVLRSLEMLERCVGPGHPNVSTELITLGVIDVMMGEGERGLPLFARAMAVEEAFFGAANPHLATTMVTLATVHAGEQRPALAEPLWRRALALLTPVPQTRQQLLLTTLNNLILTLRVQGKHKEILAFAEPLLARWELDPTVPPEALTALWNGVSEVYYHEGKLAKADKLLKRALNTAERRFGADAHELEPLLNNLVILLREMGRRHEANGYALRLAELHKQRN